MTRIAKPLTAADNHILISAPTQAAITKTKTDVLAITQMYERTQLGTNSLF